MKTDRFDEEFRRKLHGLPNESGSGDVSRIHGYVTRHLPPAPGMGWGGLAGYVVGGLVLLGSLLYNVVQYQKTTALQTTVDSLKTNPPALAQQPAPVAPPLVRTDTLYVTRYVHESDNTPNGPNPSIARNDEQRVGSMPQAISSPRESPVPVNLKAGPAISQKPAQKEAVTAIDVPTDSTGLGEMAFRVKTDVVKTDAPIHTESVRSENSAEPGAVKLSRNTVLTSKNVPNRADVSRTKTRQRTKVNGSVNNVSTRERLGTAATINQTPDDHKATNGAGGRLTESGQPRTDAEKERTEQTEVTVVLLKNRDLPPNNLSVISVRKPVYQPIAVTKAMPVRTSFRLNLPTLSLSKAQYFGGVDVMGGDEHLGGSLLGEVRINRHWSVQTGVRAMALTGFDYRSDEEFRRENGRDFRALYAPNVAPGTEIQHIRQLYGLVQIPLTVAYHYPLGRAWGLRLGVGTSVDVLARSRIRFDVDRSGRDSEHELHESNIPISLFNNVTISVGVERQWKRLLFRASPYMSPQLKRVRYKDDAFYWGGQVQVLWQFK